MYSVLARHLAAVPTDAVAGFCAATAILAALAHAIFEPTIWPDPIAALAILALGLGPVGAAFFLWDIGMKRGDPRLLGTLAYATPVASTLLLCAAGFAPFTAATLIAAALSNWAEWSWRGSWHDKAASPGGRNPAHRCGGDWPGPHQQRGATLKARASESPP